MSADVSSVKGALTRALTVAARARDKAEAKSAWEQGSKAGRATSGFDDPAFLHSSDLGASRNLLQSQLTGANDGSLKRVDDAETSLGLMEGAAAFGKAFGEQLDALTETMGRDMERLLKALGLDDDSLKEAREGLRALRGRDGTKLTDDTRALMSDASAASPRLSSSTSVSSSTTEMRVEAMNIEIALTQGDKSLRVSFDRASLELNASSSSAMRTDDASGTTITTNADETALKAGSIGLTVDASGFTGEETSSIMKRLAAALKDGSLEDRLEGAARLTPSDFQSDGSENWSLSLMGVVDKLLGADASTTDSPATRTTGGVSFLV